MMALASALLTELWNTQFFQLCAEEHNRKNWVCANSIHGARASAMIYSIVETAKANDLRVYDYLEFLLSELAEHAEDTSREFLQDLLPWSPVVQDKCKNCKKS